VRVGLPQQAWSEELAASRARFVAAMDDDLNTSAALAELFDLAKPLRGLAGRLRTVDASQYALSQAERQLDERWRLLVELAGEVLGLIVAPNRQALGLDDNVTAPVGVSSPGTAPASAGFNLEGISASNLEIAKETAKINYEKTNYEKIIYELLKQRFGAKSQKDYAKADQLRDTIINEYKVEIFDKKAGITTATGGVLQQTVVSFDPAAVTGNSPDTLP
jgi:cysteinyl-tRNA synthetase